MDFKTDWKKKYKTIIKELESKEKTWVNLESLLRKAIGRLAIAGLGIDTKLDNELKDIKNISRKKKDDKLSSALDRLSHVLSEIDENSHPKKAEVKSELDSVSNIMTQLLDLLTPPEQYQSSFERIKKHLPQNSTSILQELADELNHIMVLPLSETEERNEQSIDEVILTLLDKLSIVPGMRAKAKKIQGVIRQGLNLEQWPMVLDNIVQEVSHALQLINEEKSELESFIAQVTEQLVEITGYISEEQKEQNSGQSDAESFHKQMHEEVVKMHENVLYADDINSLKLSLDNNINSLKSNIETYLERGKQRFSAAELRNKSLRKQVISMEKETQELKKRLDENKKKLIYDTLTGIRNRMAYNDHINTLMARWQRYNEHFSYCVLDIDHFKNVNDTYGHNTGDKVLILVAKIMQKNVRKSDVLFRIGGEEFVLVLPNTDIKQAAPTIEKIRAAISQSGFHFKEEKVDIHISAGLTEVKPDDTVESIFERADKGLYQAKEAGRNQLVTVA